MTKERANKIYDILVSMGGAYEPNRDSFIYHHVEDNCDEYRFGGKLGFGGKYYSKKNIVDCYKEDETTDCIKIIKEINESLAKI